MALLNSYQKYIFQCVCSFVVGSQLVHYYLNPLGDINDLTAAKKSELWKNYLRNQTEKPIES